MAKGGGIYPLYMRIGQNAMVMIYVLVKWIMKMTKRKMMFNKIPIKKIEIIYV